MDHAGGVGVVIEIPAASYQLPARSRRRPGTWHLAPGTGIWYLVSGIGIWPSLRSLPFLRALLRHRGNGVSAAMSPRVRIGAMRSPPWWQPRDDARDIAEYGVRPHVGTLLDKSRCAAGCAGRRCHPAGIAPLRGAQDRRGGEPDRLATSWNWCGARHPSGVVDFGDRGVLRHEGGDGRRVVRFTGTTSPSTTASRRQRCTTTSHFR
jgi:hypothetical protein